MAKSFTTLEKNILKSKGLTDAQLKKLAKAGINTREDFKTVGDSATLAALVAGITKDVAAAVIAWATGGAAPAEAPSPYEVVASASLQERSSGR